MKTFITLFFLQLLLQVISVMSRVARSSVVESSTFCPKQYIFRGLAVNEEKELIPSLNAFIGETEYVCTDVHFKRFKPQ